MGKSARSPSTNAIADLAPSDLTKRSAQITKHLDAIDALMGDAVQLTDAQRKNSLRLQGESEVTALGGVLDFAEARPELFADLATEDNGSDPSTFETSLLRGRLANAATLSTLAARLDETRAKFTDSALYTATLVKKPALAAYEIAKPYQARDRQNGKLLNAAVNLYRSKAIAGAKTRAAKKAAATTAAK
jgi:hypothetical protein